MITINEATSDLFIEAVQLENNNPNLGVIIIAGYPGEQPIIITNLNDYILALQWLIDNKGEVYEDTPNSPASN